MGVEGGRGVVGAWYVGPRKGGVREGRTQGAGSVGKEAWSQGEWGVSQI